MSLSRIDSNSIAEQKQALRDITAHESITNASDADSLKTAMNSLIEQIKPE
jgi:hypothetical protein